MTRRHRHKPIYGGPSNVRRLQAEVQALQLSLIAAKTCHFETAALVAAQGELERLRTSHDALAESQSTLQKLYSELQAECPKTICKLKTSFAERESTLAAAAATAQAKSGEISLQLSASTEALMQAQHDAEGLTAEITDLHGLVARLQQDVTLRQSQLDVVLDQLVVSTDKQGALRAALDAAEAERQAAFQARDIAIAERLDLEEQSSQEQQRLQRVISDQEQLLADPDVSGKASTLAALLHQTEKQLAAANEGLYLCHVCFEHQSSVVLFPCRHFGLCRECAANVGEECPFCREVVERVEQVFHQ
jgi:chromosome segregation ATPase